MRHPHNGVLLPPELDSATEAQKDEYAAQAKATNRAFVDAYFAAGLDQFTELDEAEAKVRGGHMTPREFELRVDFGNAAMQTPADLAFALRKLADGFDTWQDWPADLIHEGYLRDANGNRVGTWSAA